MVSPQVEKETPELLEEGWREYEMVGIFRPDLSPEAVESALSALTQLMQVEGKLVIMDLWGRKKLAYPIKNFVEGVYFLIRFRSNPSFIKKLEARLKLSEELLRHLVVLTK